VQRVQGWWKDTGRPEDLLEANQLVLNDLEPYNRGTVEDAATITNSVGIGEGTIIHRHTAIRGPVVIGDRCEIGPNAYIGPYTSLGNKVTVKRGKIENSILMDGCIIDTEEKIINNLIGPYSLVTSNSEGRPRGKRLVLGERSRVEF
jgi:glucose-1-phosphate thymidylyltransferase